MKDETALQDLPVVETSAEEIRGGVIKPAETAPALRPPPPKLPPDPPPPTSFK
jgi:hypothetical protein